MRPPERLYNRINSRSTVTRIVWLGQPARLTSAMRDSWALRCSSIQSLSTAIGGHHSMKSSITQSNPAPLIREESSMKILSFQEAARFSRISIKGWTRMCSRESMIGSSSMKQWLGRRLSQSRSMCRRTWFSAMQCGSEAVFLGVQSTSLKYVTVERTIWKEGHQFVDTIPFSRKASEYYILHL